MQLCKKIAGSSDGQEVEQESPVCLRSEGGQLHSGLRELEMIRGVEFGRCKEKVGNWVYLALREG